MLIFDNLSLHVANHSELPLIGVRDLVARGYFIPGGASQRGWVGRAPAFRVARCQTWTILDSGQSPVMSHRDGF